MPYPLKKLWELCNIQNGYAFKSSDYVDFSNTLNFRMSNIRIWWELDINHNKRYLPDSYIEKYKNFLLEDWDIVIAMTDMATSPKILAIPTLIKTDNRKLLLNQRVWKFTDIDFDSLDISFLRYILLAPDSRETLLSLWGWWVQINISTKQILSLKIPLPPLPTQKAIVQKLDTAFEKIDASIELAEKSLKAIDEGNASVLEEVFGSGEYEEKKLWDIISMNYWKWVDKQDKNENGLYEVYWANGVMYFSNKFLYDWESIIIWRKWSAWALKRVSWKFWASDVTYYVTLRKNDNLDYVFNWLRFLNLPSLAQWVKPWINRNHVYKLKLPLPPHEKQKEIVAHLDQVFAVNAELKRAYEEKIAHLRELKQSLLREAFEGRLVKE